MFNFFNNNSAPTTTPRRPTELYETLGVKPDATQDEIKRAYRKLAMKHHPDKGGTETMFKTITTAYETLSNGDSRKKYDSPEPDINEMFASMFSRRPAPPPTSTKIKPVVVEVFLSMEDIFNGCTQTVSFPVTRTCRTCVGAGGSNVRTCENCKGKGVNVVLKQIGRGMLQQFHMPCTSCQGKGQIIGALCIICTGAGRHQTRTTTEIKIKPNTLHGDKISLGNMGHEVDGAFGPVVGIVQIRKHALFTNVGSVLYLTQTLTLVQALFGTTLYVVHINGTTIKIQSPPGLQPGATQLMKGLGMTTNHVLEITYQVRLPTAFDPGHRKQLVELLS